MAGKRNGRIVPSRVDSRSPRQRALEAAEGVVLQGHSLTRAVEHATEGLNARDAAWVQALAYTTLRWYPQLSALVNGFLERPLRKKDAVIGVLLAQGLAELMHFSTRDHAAVRETAELARAIHRPGAVGLINAVLRRAQREQDALEAAVREDPALRYAVPEWLLEAIRASWPDDWEMLLEAATRPAPMTLRVNLSRTSREDALQALVEAGHPAQAHPQLEAALTLEEPADVARLPGFAEGRLSVQDASAQWAAVLLDPQPGERVLDACAAPGGKTGHLLERAGGDLQLTALDNDAERLVQVRENLDRLGFAAQLTAADVADPDAWWDGQPFDAILLDVPCSATGVIRRHPDIKTLRRADDIPRLAAEQARILEAAWGLLRPGGRLLYATCSLLSEENDAVVAGFLQRTPDARALEPEGGPPIAGAHVRSVGWALPLGLEGGDGFYYALLTKD
ncbi:MULTISPECIES: 16S rRNA (cytosine(967)-C(5))-methyltransferase RsmB [unclassified Thioalkalivibrio]|uniref:16S rRNA (cytosine(967)-C(5))-methyltransferase RsmB n=1 Tax=unclassified Thioalkalivibrio TaxID=2621013 RepID=UPI00035CFF88|nr:MULTISPECIES: 16S rRNA (cytosine(967)-C(5))-methyltransferase RsmB [unclassified Thioalkalivibrio]